MSTRRISARAPPSKRPSSPSFSSSCALPLVARYSASLRLVGCPEKKCLSEFSRITGQLWVKSLFFQYSRVLDKKNDILTGSRPLDDQPSLNIQEVTFFGTPFIYCLPKNCQPSRQSQGRQLRVGRILTWRIMAPPPPQWSWPRWRQWLPASSRPKEMERNLRSSLFPDPPVGDVQRQKSRP